MPRIALIGPCFALGLDMRGQEFSGDFLERSNCSLGFPSGNRVLTLLNAAEQLLGLGACFFWRQSTMVADSTSSRTAALPILADIGFPAPRVGCDPEPCQGIVPQEFTVLAGGTR